MDKIKKQLTENIQYDYVIDDIAYWLSYYRETVFPSRIYLSNDNYTLADELWYRLCSGTETSEHFSDYYMLQLKANFYRVVKIHFSHFVKIDNYYTVKRRLQHETL